MKKFLLTMMAVTVAVSLMACGDTATNAPANATNASNTAVKSTAAPTAESLLEMDKKATEAFLNGDTKHFEQMLSAKFVSYHNGVRHDRNDEIKMIGSLKCVSKEVNLDEPKMVKIDDSNYILTYKATIDAECERDGNKMKVPSPTRAATLWTKVGDQWMGAYHGETLIIDPTAPPAAAKTDDAKKEEPKKDAPAANTAANSNSAANTASAPAPAKPTPSANTEALTKLHNGGWEAWRTNDAKWFNDTLIESASYVDMFGAYHSGKAALTKLWTDATACEGVTKTTYADTFATAITPTVEVLTGKGTADGKCGGQPNSPLYQTAIYVKEGDAWKMAFNFSSPAR